MSAGDKQTARNDNSPSVFRLHVVFGSNLDPGYLQKTSFSLAAQLFEAIGFLSFVVLSAVLGVLALGGFDHY